MNLLYAGFIISLALQMRFSGFE